jgi:hypothetical protein
LAAARNSGRVAVDGETKPMRLPIPMPWSCRLRLVALTALVALVALSLPACGGAFAEGKSEFQSGHYPHAKQIFASLEAESRGYDEPKRAEYALYRGLTLSALGDRAQAGTWLREAQALEGTRPGTLSHEDALRLKAALENSE